MKTVIVDKNDITIGIKSSGLTIETQHIPFRLIDMLVLCGEMEVGTKTLLALSKEHIPILVISKNNKNFSLTLPLEAKNSDLKIQQYTSATTNRLGFAKYFLEEKIKNHSSHLKQIGISVETNIWLQKINSAESIPELLGVEGSFSRIYFKHYFATIPKVLHKGKRSKKPPLDPVNAILSYLYTYFYNVITARLYIYGFDASISYLHEPFRSHNGLSSDLLEIYRSEINKKVAQWFLDETLTSDDFTRRNGIFLRYESRKRLWKEIKEFGNSLMPKIDDEIALLRSAIS